MSAIEMVIEKVKHLDETHARQLLTWLQGKERAAASTPPPVNAITHPDFLTRAKTVWGEQPAGKPLSELVAEARGGGS